MALPLTEADKRLLLSALGTPETRDRVVALLDLAGTGNVTGPSSSTDNAIARYDGTTGALIQNSSVLIDDLGAISGVSDLSLSGQVLTGNGSETSPSLSFTSDTNTGFYRTSADSIGLSVGGQRQFSFLDSGGPNIVFSSDSAESSFIYWEAGQSDRRTVISGGTGSGSGANLRLHGTSHASFPSQMHFVINSTLRGFIDVAGNWSIGAVGGAQTHTVNNNLRVTGNFGVGNTAAATTLGTVTRRMEIFDASGTSLGFVPIYDTIT